MSLILWSIYLTVGAIFIYGRFNNKVNLTYRIGDFCRLLLAPILLIIYLYLTTAISYWIVASLILTGLAYSLLWKQFRLSLFTKAFYLLAIANICWAIFFALKITIDSANTGAGIILIIVFISFGYLLYLVGGKRILLRQKSVIVCGITGIVTCYLAGWAFFTVASKGLLVGFCGSLALLLCYALDWWPMKNKLLRSCGALSMVIAYMYLLLGSF